MPQQNVGLMPSASTLDGLASALANDYSVFDQQETITLQSTRKANEQVDQIPGALRMQISTKEQQMTGGVYTAGAVSWNLPASLVRWAVKPGDVLIDKDQNLFTVIQADLGGWATFWHLLTVNLAIAYDLRDTIDIQRAQGFPQFVQDAAGAYVKNFPPSKGATTPYAGIVAKVQPLTMEQREERGIRGSAIRYDVFCNRQMPDVTIEDRVLWYASITPGQAQTILEIRGWRNTGHLEELFTLECEQAP